MLSSVQTRVTSGESTISTHEPKCENKNKKMSSLDKGKGNDMRAKGKRAKGQKQKGKGQKGKRAKGQMGKTTNYNFPGT